MYEQPLECVCAQVLFCYEQFDELTLLHLREFDKKKLISVETDIVVDHYKEEKFQDSKPGLFLYHLHSALNFVAGQLEVSRLLILTPISSSFSLQPLSV